MLTSVCLLGMLVCAVDLALPTISDKFLRSAEWYVAGQHLYILRYCTYLSIRNCLFSHSASRLSYLEVSAKNVSTC